VAGDVFIPRYQYVCVCVVCVWGGLHHRTPMLWRRRLTPSRHCHAMVRDASATAIHEEDTLDQGPVATS